MPPQNFGEKLTEKEKKIALQVIQTIRRKIPGAIDMKHAINADSSAGAGHTIGHNSLRKEILNILNQLSSHFRDKEGER